MQYDTSPAVVYAAKSTEDRRGSIPTQLTDAREMAEREGWEVVGEYSEEAASAWSGNRGPELDQAMKHAERLAHEHGSAILVVQHSDRLARGDARQARHLVEVVTWALKAGVTIRSVQDDLFADERVALLMGALMGQRNTEDSRRKSEATKAGLKRRREAGKHHGGIPPYGVECIADPDNRKETVHAPHPAQAEVVRRIFAEAIAGRTQLAIARDLRKERVPTARGRKWHQSTVGKVLANPVHLRLGIIDRTTWEKVEALRTGRARTHISGRPPAGHHLFRKGMLRCGECGAAMVPRTDRNRHGDPYEAYYCYGHHEDPESCPMPTFQRSWIDAPIYRHFEQVGLDVEATRAQLAEARDRKLGEVRALREQAEREARVAAEALARVRRDYQRGAIEADDWAEQRPQLTEECDAAQAQAKRMREKECEVETD